MRMITIIHNETDCVIVLDTKVWMDEAPIVDTKQEHKYNLTGTCKGGGGQGREF